MSLKTLRQEAKEELQAILSYWLQHTIDEKHGGFVGRLDNRNVVDAQAEKGAVLTARVLWAFSAASQLEHEPSYKAAADRAFHYLSTRFVDRGYGGVYWTVTHEGQPAQTKKQVYAQAFAIYACSEYYKLSKVPAAKQLAMDLYTLLERYSHDSRQGGYFEAFSRYWTEAEDLRLSEKDANEKKTMNTHLHVLEGYANLYTIWPDAGLRKQIQDLLRLFQTRIIDTSTGHLRLFFTDDWERKDALISYGHDIEASWLLLEAAEIIGDTALIERFKTLALRMADATLEGTDGDGGLWYETDDAHQETIREKHWWVQAEAVVGFLSAWQLSGEARYKEQALKTWSFIKQYILDKENGEWIWGVKEDYRVMEEDKVGVWKCPYHNGRACLEIMKRLA